MKSRYHVIMSLALSIPFLVYGEYIMGFLCMTSGIFIDVDHLVDYYYHYGTITFSVTELSEGLITTGICICPIHSWEVVAAMSVLSFYHRCLFGVLVGITLHIVADMFTNSITAMELFFLVRMRQRWRIWTL